MLNENIRMKNKWWVLLQIGILEWLHQNALLTFFLFFILFVIIFALYLRFYVRILYDGTRYRHYRKGRLLRESDKGGIVFLLPFFDKLEVIDSDPSTDHDTIDDSVFN